ncbi:hypothetical protein [Shewanella sp. 6_MG-2023]|uniref:hypothetical protein n=1 Tax=Shewanella sp. 6_MG-2023 TaxID=3062660 RepID=UPI0026E1C2E8|nr:hypothetical protein [Shewanella sp. 6_MG-2023]MDO6620404.1 hypothetical protein [Shewanella sp. 6_MG-2023]
MIVSQDNYFYVLIARFLNALKCIRFWREGFVIFFFGSMGVWLPVFFGWIGYTSIFDPKTVFTFGIATMVMILEARIFMSPEDDNKYSKFTLLVVFLGSIFAVLAYFKSITITTTDPESAISWVQRGLLITGIVWLYNVINKSEYDPTLMTGTLGGDI